MIKSISLIIGAALCLTACGTPQQFAERRAAHNHRILPDPADRVGIYLAFPVSEAVLVTYFPEQVSEEEILRRFETYCSFKRSGSVPVKDPDIETVDDMVTDGNGQKLAAKRMTVLCEKTPS